MAHAVIIFLGLVITGCSLTVTEAVPASDEGGEHASCATWDRLASHLTTSTGAQQVCHSSGTKPCTRIDCNGAFQYNSENTDRILNLGGRTIEVDYCFGVILNHCDHNISLDFYMQVPDRGVDQTTRVFHNTLLSIPGLSYASNSSSGISFQGYLYFQMQRTNDTVTFSVTVKVRMKFAGFVTWPDHLQRRLIRDESVPVPPCDPKTVNTSTATPSIAQCHPPHWKTHQAKGPAEGKELEDLGKPCNEAEGCTRDPWMVCDLQTNRCVCDSNFEPIPNKNPQGPKMCRPLIKHGHQCQSDDHCNLAMSERCFKGTCQCQDGAQFNPVMEVCQPSSHGGGPVTNMPHIETDPPNSGRGGMKPVPHVEPLPAANTSDDDGKKKPAQNTAAIISASVVGGFVVLGGLLLAAYFAIRRLRRPYHNRQLLLEGEDSDGIM